SSTSRRARPPNRPEYRTPHERTTMSRISASIRRRGTTYPVNTWYGITTQDEVSRQPLARRALETPVVLYRTQDGQAVALEDRDAHRPYLLRPGRVAGR